MAKLSVSLHADPLALEQSKQRRLLGVLGLRRITGRGTNAAILLGDQVGGPERLVGRISPQFRRKRWCRRSAKASASRSASALIMIAA